ncbi:response regulator [Pedobacter sp. AW1-32]|uniref:response regulator n=1 Tax=Pedobacter sp. AW1-32 TaxID=3383026 RepID=UPI003FEF5466
MLKNVNVLIADDSELMRVVMEAFCKKLNSSLIAGTDNITDTYRILRNNHFDLLFLDISMPQGNNHHGTITELLEIQPWLKICIFSGYEKSALAPAFLAAGAVSFIQKDENMANSVQEMVQKVFN